MPLLRRRARVRLHRAQAAFRRSEAAVRGFAGGRGAGKSWVGAYDLLRRAGPGRLYLAGAPTYTVLRDATWRSLLAVGAALGCVASSYRSDPPRLVLANGAEVLGRSADDPERFRGPNLSGAWLDEASQTAEAAYLLLLACLREAGQMGWLSLTFTPRGRTHWTYSLFHGPGGTPAGGALFHARSAENPFLPREFVGQVRQRYTPAMARQELGGEFVDIEGAVFKAAWLVHTWADTGGAWRLDGSRLVMQDRCTVIVVCDPAASAKQTADYTAIGTFALTPANDLLVLDMVRERLDVEAVVPRIKQACDRWRPAYVALEANGFQVALAREARRTPGMPPVRELTPGGKDKLVRATEAMMRAQAGQVYLPAAAPWLPDFLDEVLHFTGTAPGEHDDQVDVLAYAARIQSGKITQAAGGTPYVIGR